MDWVPRAWRVDDDDENVGRPSLDVLGAPAQRMSDNRLDAACQFSGVHGPHARDRIGLDTDDEVTVAARTTNRGCRLTVC